jgi:hypothetical protein
VITPPTLTEAVREAILSRVINHTLTTATAERIAHDLAAKLAPLLEAAEKVSANRIRSIPMQPYYESVTADLLAYDKARAAIIEWAR